jgi:hypothetical protein
VHICHSCRAAELPHMEIGLESCKREAQNLTNPAIQPWLPTCCSTCCSLLSLPSHSSSSPPNAPCLVAMLPPGGPHRGRGCAVGAAGHRPPAPRHHLVGALPHCALRDLARRHGPLMSLSFGEIRAVVASCGGGQPACPGRRQPASQPLPRRRVHGACQHCLGRRRPGRLPAQHQEPPASLPPSVRNSREVQKKYRGVKWSIHLPNTRRNTIKERKYIQWHENQVSHVWSPIFAKPMLVMAKLRSAMFGVPNMQFSRGRCEWIDWHARTCETDAVCK